MTREEALDVLMSDVCSCGTHKGKMKSFCGYCSLLIPREIAKALLIAALGGEYEQLHAQAQIIIKDKRARVIERDVTGERQDD